MKSCNHLLGIKEVSGYDYNYEEVISTSDSINDLLQIDSKFKFCPKCGENISHIVDLRINAWNEEKERVRLEKEKITKEKQERVIEFLKSKGLESFVEGEYYRIEIRSSISDRVHILWSIDTLIIHLMNESLTNIEISIYELPSLDEIESKMTSEGYEKQDDSFWYEWRKENRGVTIDRFNTYTGLLFSGQAGNRIEDFEAKLTATTSSPKLDELLGFKFELKKVL